MATRPHKATRIQSEAHIRELLAKTHQRHTKNVSFERSSFTPEAYSHEHTSIQESHTSSLTDDDDLGHDSSSHDEEELQADDASSKNQDTSLDAHMQDLATSFNQGITLKRTKKNKILSPACAGLRTHATINPYAGIKLMSSHDSDDRPPAATPSKLDESADPPSKLDDSDDRKPAAKTSTWENSNAPSCFRGLQLIDGDESSSRSCFDGVKLIDGSEFVQPKVPMKKPFHKVSKPSPSMKERIVPNSSGVGFTHHPLPVPTPTPWLQTMKRPCPAPYWAENTPPLMSLEDLCDTTDPLLDQPIDLTQHATAIYAALDGPTDAPPADDPYPSDIEDDDSEIWRAANIASRNPAEHGLTAIAHTVRNQVASLNATIASLNASSPVPDDTNVPAPVPLISTSLIPETPFASASLAANTSPATSTDSPWTTVVANRRQRNWKKDKKNKNISNGHSAY